MTDDCKGENTREKNLSIIREEIRKEIVEGMDYADNEFHRLSGGLSGTIMGPFFKLAYQCVAKDHIKSRAFKQLDLLLECARTYEDGKLDDIINERFSDYLNCDETYLRTKRSHPQFEQLRKMLMDTFRSRLQVVILFMNGNGSSYAELVRSVVDQRDARKILGRDLHYVGNIISLIERERDILDVPSIAKDDVIKMLRISYEYARHRLEKRIAEIYSD